MAKLEMGVFCYRTAYFVLPQLLFGNEKRTLVYFASKEGDSEGASGAFIYMMASQMLQQEPEREHLMSFKAHCGILRDDIEYSILEYPQPTPFVLNQSSVLAPYFSAIVHSSAAEASYYVLGQNPLNGTTLRTVSRDGANANLGKGCEPDLASFLALLSQRISV